MRSIAAIAGALAAALAFCWPGVPARAAADVTRATLANGLQVVVVHNPLAPVVTAMMNYRVGSDEQWVPGLAHATEHMMFRGSATLSSAQLMEALEITGGNFDADTQSTATQYFFTVPAQYLDIALRAERSRATGELMAQAQWKQERGAITQEVTQDQSDAIYRLFVKMQSRLIGGTPYDKNGLGTVEGFARDVNGTQLLRFYRRWYHPNNAVYVIVGDVDGPATVAKVRALFGDVPAAPLPQRPPVRLQPLHAATYHDTSDQAYTAVMLGYRLPGYDSPDYAASQILGDVLDNQRSDFGAMPYTGAALGAEFFAQSFPKTAIGIAFVAVPVTTKPESTDRAVRAILARYRRDGVPPDLVAAAKLREIAQLEFTGNSIEGMADEWSQAIAVQGLHSPDDMIAHFAAVKASDVDRVLRRYLKDSTAVAAYAVPKNAGAASSGGGGLAKENNTFEPSSHEPLPPWAQRVLDDLRVPAQTLSPADMTLSNGIRLIVQPETITHTVVVRGEILSNPGVQEPAGEEGVADLASGVLPYGTTTYDRVAFQRALDDIAASTTAGTDFGLDALSADFDRGVQLLADEELHPALDPKSFAIVKRQNVAALSGDAKAPDHLAEVALAGALYPPGDPERRFATPQSVGGLSLDDVKRWYAAAYRPDLTTIVVIGDTTPERARAIVEKYFGAWRSEGPKPNVEPSPVPANAAAQIAVPATGRVQSSVRLVETVPVVRTDSAWALLRVANAALTGGFYSSLLYHDLREVHGYAYSIDSSFNAGRVRGSFEIGYGCDAKNIVPAEGQTLAVLRDLQQQPIEAGRLLRSKALLMGELPIRQSSYEGVAGQLSAYATSGLPLDQNLLDARAELDASAESIRAAMARYVRPDAFVRLVVGPEPP